MGETTGIDEFHQIRAGVSLDAKKLLPLLGRFLLCHCVQNPETTVLYGLDHDTVKPKALCFTVSLCHARY